MIESRAGEHGEVRDKELNESEPTDEASLAKIGHIRTEGQFCSWDNFMECRRMVMLNSFVEKSSKQYPAEIKKAERLLKEWEDSL